MRSPTLVSLAALAAAALSPFSATAEEVRYYEKDGVTYKETRRTVQRPVTETRYETREQTVYQEQYRTELQESYRTYATPVTEYRWQQCLRGVWNPFVQPYWTYELRPTRRWEPRQEVLRYPVAQRELVPVTRTVQVPVTTQRMAEEEVITRVAVSAAAPDGRIGGIARLDNDPPRQSTQVPASGTVIRR